MCSNALLKDIIGPIWAETKNIQQLISIIVIHLDVPHLVAQMKGWSCSWQCQQCVWHVPCTSDSNVQLVDQSPMTYFLREPVGPGHIHMDLRAYG